MGEIIGLDNIINEKVILLLGKPKDTELVLNKLREKNRFVTDYWKPYPWVYFEEYHADIQDLFVSIKFVIGNIETDGVNKGQAVIICQSKEYIDCMLREERINFVVSTVRYCPDNTYRIRTLSKEEALKMRVTFDMELRA